jgi:hypothetical protein
MTTVLLAGTGAVGLRAARQLVDSSGVDRLLVGARRPRYAHELAAALGAAAEPHSFRAGDEIPDGVDVVASALPDELDAAVARAAVDAGVPIASAADCSGAIAALRSLDAAAVDCGVTIAAGCGFAPGLSEVLARHAATLYESVDEVRVARAGWAGPCSAAAVRRERRDVPAVYRDGVWRESGHRVEQVWFPEPVAVAECDSVRGGSELVLDAMGRVDAVTWLLADVVRRRFRRHDDDGFGAIRVEVYGRRADARDVTVYGALDRVSIATGAVLALAALRLAAGPTPPGMHSLGALVDTTAFLGELATRGVRAAAFEGAPVS